jgi:hypothetical protein
LSERNPYIDAGKGVQAKELLENPIMAEAFAELERRYMVCGSRSASWPRSSATCGW